MVKGGRGRLDIAFPCYSEGLAAGRGSTESLKFVDPSVHSHRSSTGFDIPQGAARAVTGSYAGRPLYKHGTVVLQVTKCPLVNFLRSQF